MGFWDSVKKDAQKGLKVGLNYAKEKAGELTDEGKRRYKIFDLKGQVHRQMAELGGLVYDISGTGKNPLLNAKVKATVGKIGRLEAQITKLEGKPVKKKK